MDVGSPAKIDADRILQDSRSPSEKRNLEVDGANDTLNPREEHARSTKESDGGLTDLTKQTRDLSENSPSKERVVGHDRATDLEQQCSESPSKKQKQDSKQAEEYHFYRLFKNVLDKVKDEWKVCDKQIEKAIDTIIKSFYYRFGHNFSEVNLSIHANICGYLFRLATLDAGLVRFRCLQAFENCSILEHMLRKTELRVVCLGGGPGNGIVGFLSALHELRHPRGCHLEVLVVDAVDAWEDCVDSVNNLIRKVDFGGVSEICRENKVDITFHKTVLPCTLTIPCNANDCCCEALKNADIILISRFISVLGWEEKKKIMNNVHNLIQNTSLVIFIDAPMYTDMLAYFEDLYHSEEDKYELSREKNERFNRTESGASDAHIFVLRRKIIDSNLAGFKK